MSGTPVGLSGLPYFTIDELHVLPDGMAVQLVGALSHVHGVRNDGGCLLLPDGAEDLGVRDGGWEHEHCELCNAHTGGPGDPRGFVNPDDRWLCATCHARYTVPRDLSFVIEE